MWHYVWKTFGEDSFVLFCFFKGNLKDSWIFYSLYGHEPAQHLLKKVCFVKPHCIQYVTLRTLTSQKSFYLLETWEISKLLFFFKISSWIPWIFRNILVYIFLVVTWSYRKCRLIFKYFHPIFLWNILSFHQKKCLKGQDTSHNFKKAVDEILKQ